MRKLSVVICALVLAQVATAEWVTKSSRDQDGATGPLVYRHVDLEDAELGTRAILDLAIFNAKSFRLRVIENANRVQDLMSALRETNFPAGVNGGYFDPTFAPIGLRVIDGKTVSPLTRGRLLSGVLTSNGSVQISRLSEFSRSKKYNAAIECGPFLVDFARSVRGLEASRSARRTFAAIGSGGRAALGYCPEATLADLAKILALPLGDFKVERALNLDGGSSSAFYFKGKMGVFSFPEEKSVRDFVALAPK